MGAALRKRLSRRQIKDDGDRSPSSDPSTREESKPGSAQFETSLDGSTAYIQANTRTIPSRGTIRQVLSPSEHGEAESLSSLLRMSAGSPSGRGRCSSTSSYAGRKTAFGEDFGDEWVHIRNEPTTLNQGSKTSLKLEGANYDLFILTPDKEDMRRSTSAEVVPKEGFQVQAQRADTERRSKHAKRQRARRQQRADSGASVASSESDASTVPNSREDPSHMSAQESPLTNTKPCIYPATSGSASTSAHTACGPTPANSPRQDSVLPLRPLKNSTGRSSMPTDIDAITPVVDRDSAPSDSSSDMPSTGYRTPNGTAERTPSKKIYEQNNTRVDMPYFDSTRSKERQWVSQDTLTSRPDIPW
jgi:hypothetical protein